MVRGSFTIGVKLGLALGLLVLLITSLGLFAMSQATTIGDSIGVSLARSFEAADAAGAADDAARDLGQSYLVQAGKGLASDAREVKRLGDAFRVAVARLRVAGGDAEAGQRLERLFAALLEKGEATVKANAAQDWAQAGEAENAFVAVRRDLDAELRAAAASNRRGVQAEIDAARRSVALQGWLLLAGAGVCVLVAGVLVVVLRRQIVLPLARLTEVATLISERGDLTQRVEAVTGDEIGALGTAFGRMVDRLRSLTAELADATRRLGESASALADATREQNDRVTRQAGSLQDTRATTQEINDTSAAVAAQASAVLAVAVRAEEVGRAGEASIDRSLAGLGEMRTQLEAIRGEVTSLEAQRGRIGTITATVKNLADQSDMLALNAAIQAATSGEHGAGFGVVAREMRALANESLESTRQVESILAEMNRAIGRVVASTEAGAQRTERQLDEVRATGVNVAALSGIVRENLGAVRKISDAVVRQNDGIGRVLAAVSELSEATGKTLESLTATDRATAVVRSVSERVERAVAGYRT